MFCLLNAFGAIRTDRNHMGANRFLNLFLLEFNHAGQLSSLLLQVKQQFAFFLSFFFKPILIFTLKKKKKLFKAHSIRSNSFILSTSSHVELPHLLLSNLRRKPVATQRASSQQRRRDHARLVSLQLDVDARTRGLRRRARSRRRLAASARIRERRDQGVV